MFFQNLSAATERKARSTGGGQKKKKDEDDDSTSSSSSSVPRSTGASSSASTRHKHREPPELIYNEGNPPPREVMLAFLLECGEKMKTTDAAEGCVEDAKYSEDGLHKVCMEYQRDELEYTYGIERNFGSKYLGTIPQNFPDDIEINEAASTFIFLAMQLYMNALKARAKGFKKLRSKGGMTALTMHEFFEGCNALMAMPETKATLREVFTSTGKEPNEKVIELQRSVLALLGLEPEYGVSCLNRISTDFPDDRVLMMKMQHFAMCAQVACKESTMTDEQRESFYKDCPPFMRHCPHIFVMQQQMMKHRQMMEHQQQAREEMILRQSMGGAPPSSVPSPSSTAAEPSEGAATEDRTFDHSHFNQRAQSMMEGVMADPESRALVEEVSLRIQRSGVQTAQKVMAWTAEQRRDFANDFSKNPLLNEINALGMDPIARLRKFASMSDEEIDSVLTLQAVVAIDMRLTGGANIGVSQASLEGARNMLASSAASASAASGQPGTSNGANSGGLLSGLFSAIGAITGGGKEKTSAGAGHDHSHVHGPGCSHASVPSAPDVVSGKSDVMDR